MQEQLSDQEADLVYVPDKAPGMRRIGAGRGFFYRDAKGRKVTDPSVLDRITALAIPPAWTDVWICADPAGHLQATGRDARNRKQYRYHPAWSAWRDAQKFSGLVAFAHRLPALRRTVAQDMGASALSRDRVLATVVRLLDKTLIRIGNDVYADENQSYGLTTLRGGTCTLRAQDCGSGSKANPARSGRLTYQIAGSPTPSGACRNCPVNACSAMWTMRGSCATCIRMT